MTSAAPSHHFIALRRADLVCIERRGQYIVHSLHSTVFEDVARMLPVRFPRAESTVKVMIPHG